MEDIAMQPKFSCCENQDIRIDHNYSHRVCIECGEVDPVPVSVAYGERGTGWSAQALVPYNHRHKSFRGTLSRYKVPQWIKDHALNFFEYNIYRIRDIHAKQGLRCLKYNAVVYGILHAIDDHIKSVTPVPETRKGQKRYTYLVKQIYHLYRMEGMAPVEFVTSVSE